MSEPMQSLILRTLAESLYEQGYTESSRIVAEVADKVRDLEALVAWKDAELRQVTSGMIMADDVTDEIERIIAGPPTEPRP